MRRVIGAKTRKTIPARRRSSAAPATARRGTSAASLPCPTGSSHQRFQNGARTTSRAFGLSNSVTYFICSSRRFFHALNPPELRKTGIQIAADRRTARSDREGERPELRAPEDENGRDRRGGHEREADLRADAGREGREDRRPDERVAAPPRDRAHEEDAGEKRRRGARAVRERTHAVQPDGRRERVEERADERPRAARAELAQEKVEREDREVPADSARERRRAERLDAERADPLPEADEDRVARRVRMVHADVEPVAHALHEEDLVPLPRVGSERREAQEREDGECGGDEGARLLHEEGSPSRPDPSAAPRVAANTRNAGRLAWIRNRPHVTDARAGGSQWTP